MVNTKVFLQAKALLRVRHLIESSGEPHEGLLSSINDCYQRVYANYLDSHERDRLDEAMLYWDGYRDGAGDNRDRLAYFIDPWCMRVGPVRDYQRSVAAAYVCRESGLPERPQEQQACVGLWRAVKPEDRKAASGVVWYVMGFEDGALGAPGSF
jgi:hypothetical protein